MTHDTNNKSMRNSLPHKQAQLIAMHSKDFQSKVVQPNDWLSVGCYLPNILYKTLQSIASHYKQMMHFCSIYAILKSKETPPKLLNIKLNNFMSVCCVSI